MSTDEVRSGQDADRVAPQAACPPQTGFARLPRLALHGSPERGERQVRRAVACAKAGDQEAIRFLYVTYSRNVLGYVRSILHDEHEAEDVTQHVFAKLLTAIAKYDDRGLPFLAWLLRMARNCAIDHLRANRATPVEEIFDPEHAASFDRDRSDAVQAALAELPLEQRQVVIMRHLMGYTPGEIAVRMGRSESSVHGLHHRGRRALRRSLSDVGAAPQTRRPRNLHSAAA